MPFPNVVTSVGGALSTYEGKLAKPLVLTAFRRAYMPYLDTSQLKYYRTLTGENRVTKDDDNFIVQTRICRPLDFHSRRKAGGVQCWRADTPPLSTEN